MNLQTRLLKLEASTRARTGPGAIAAMGFCAIRDALSCDTEEEQSAAFRRNLADIERRFGISKPSKRALEIVRAALRGDDEPEATA